MAVVWADQGVHDAAEAIRQTAPFPTLKVHLFTNNVNPSNATVLADFTEATFAGYVAQSLTTPNPAVDAAHISTVTAVSVSFTITAGAQNIYGWYVTNSANTRLMWSQRDAAAPVAMDAAGINVFTLTLSYSDKDQAT